ncbi:MAG: LPS export ABC transporter periplasmic protein LptC [Candidatus Cloacimonetes bacterium]|nr:LPS export ABC transporter periplasmic protein LptC [Candidatus Cloacimonadota bacterium]
MKKKIAILIRNSSFLVIILLLLCCENREENISSEAPILASIETTDTLIIYSSSQNKIEWILHSDFLQKFADKNIMNFRNVKLEIFDQNQNLSSTIFADSAKVDENKNLIITKGNIKIFSKEGDLFGNVLTWNRNNDKIFSDDWVKIVKDGNTIYGEQLRTDSHFEHVVLQKVSAKGEISESKVVW